MAYYSLRRLALFAVCSCFLCFMFTTHLWHALQGNRGRRHIFAGNIKDTSYKYILFWQNVVYNALGIFLIDKRVLMFHDINCSRSLCYVTASENLMPEDEYDAIVFHSYHNISWDVTSRLPASRNLSQRYVLYTLQSPHYSTNIHEYPKHYFNWTMTYRMDSDIPVAHGRVIPKDYPLDPPLLPFPKWRQPETVNSTYEEVMASKTRLASTFMFSCVTESKSEKYLSMLTPLMEVDTYGMCATSGYPPGSYIFYKELHRYKFFLAFENSLCDNYMSNKLTSVLEHYVVPVVYGGANYRNLLPPMSYINIADYESPKELSDYLDYLDRFDEEYIKYFWWKKYYKVQTNCHYALCSLCEMLHGNQQVKYYDMHQWWNPINMCIRPNI